MKALAARLAAATLAGLAGLGVAPGAATAQTPADSVAIRAAALDYIEGFYTGDAERMDNALHDDLKKRIVQRKPGAPDVLEEMTKAELVEMTAGGGGSGMPEDLKVSDVTILDIYGGMASVKIVAGAWVDYMHIARVNGDWKIVNVLWEMRPRG